MTSKEQRVPAKGGRRMTWEDRDFEFPEQPVASLSDIDEFLEDGGGSGRERSRGSFSSEEDLEMEALEGDEEREDSCGNAEESKKFWESQHQLLQVIYRPSFVWFSTRYASFVLLMSESVFFRVCCVGAHRRRRGSGMRRRRL